LVFKTLGCVLIVAAFAATGMTYTSSLNKRICGLSSMIELFSAIKIKINYEFTSLPEILSAPSLQTKKETADFLKNCATLMENGKDLKHSWNQSIDRFSEKMFLDKGDVTILKDFSANLGDSDVGGQIANISLYLDLLKANLKKAETIAKDKTRVAMSLSVFSGLIFSILLV